jgi:4-amino-4-deoxy-L-arabinose transferase-like glycosyltransferase
MMFAVVARAATPDCCLVFFSTLAIYFFATRCPESEVAGSGGADAGESAAQPDGATTIVHQRAGRLSGFAAWSLVYAAMALAVLSKGPIGVLLPAAVIGLFLMLSTPPSGSSDNSWRCRAWSFLRRLGPASFLRSAWRMRPLLGVVVVMLVAGPWFLAVHLRTGGEFLREFFWTHHVQRFSQPLDNHQGPWWYYVPAILAGFFPWSIFLLPAAVETIRSLRGGGRRGRAMLLLVCWIAVYFLFFSKASTKLPSYVLPAYPALALAVGCFIDRWLRRPAEVSRAWPRIAFGTLAAVGAALIALPVAARHQISDGESLLEALDVAPGLEQPLGLVAWLGATLMGGGIACLVCEALSRRRLAMGAMAATALLLIVGALAGVALSVDRLQSSQELARAIRLSGAAAPRVAQFGYFRPSLVYYTRTRLENCRSLEDAAQFLAQSSDNFLVMPAEDYRRLLRRLPSDVTVLWRAPQFPKSGEIVLLARRAPTTQP